MRVLLDCSQTRKGGGIQAALAVLGRAATDSAREWHVALSPELAKEVPLELRESFAAHRALPPARTALGRLCTPGRHMPGMEMAVRPDVVFTLFGPAWWKARAPHVVGFAQSLAVYPDSPAYDRLPLLARTQMRFENLLRRRDLRRADHLIVETSVMRDRTAWAVGFPRRKIFVVRNTFSPHVSGSVHPPQAARERGVQRVLVPAAYYPYKNLEMIPLVAEALRALTRQSFEFVLMLPPEEPGWLRIHAIAKDVGVEDLVRTVGAVRHQDIASHYRGSDAVFLPTLQESSTAVYPEAFSMGVPLLTSDLPFAKELCGDAAVFFDPFSVGAAAEALGRVLCDDDLKATMIVAGRRQLESYLTPEEKWRDQIGVLERVVQLASG